MQDAQELAKLTVFEEQAFFNKADPLGEGMVLLFHHGQPPLL